MIIPIGIQCLNSTLKKRINKDTKTLPFDWMLSHPKFVYEILKLLLENKINIEEIVNNHFFIVINGQIWRMLKLIILIVMDSHYIIQNMM